jgi:hypothetical protein
MEGGDKSEGYGRRVSEVPRGRGGAGRRRDVMSGAIFLEMDLLSRFFC